MEKLRDLVKRHLETVLILVTFLPLYGLVLVLLLTIGIPMFSIQSLVAKLAKYFHPEWAGLMTGKDVVVGADDIDKPRNVLLWYNTLDGNVSLEEIRQNLNELVVQRKKAETGDLIYPKYQQYFEPWLGFNFWKWDTNFDIRNHVKFLPGSNEFVLTTERQLISRLGQVASAGFPAGRPYWECLCVPNYLPKGESVPKRTMVVYRIHHGIGDGYSFLKCFMQHLCNDDLEKVIKLKEPKAKRLNVFLRAVNLAWFFIQIPYLLLRQCFIDIDSNSWFLPSSQLTGECHLSMTKKISIPAIKAVCKEFNVSFTSALFSALAGGINKYFKRKYFGASARKEMPDMMRCFTPFPWMNHPNNKLTNHWTCASVPLFPGIDSAQERMERTERILQTLKASPIPLANHLLLPIGATFPVWIIRFGNWFNTAILSNFPGPTELVRYYKKYTVDDLNFWAPHLNGNAGIGITMISYGTAMRFGLNFDKAILPHQQDVDDLSLYIEEEFEKLFNKKVDTEEEIYKEAKKLLQDENDNGINQRRNPNLLRHRSVS